MCVLYDFISFIHSRERSALIHQEQLPNRRSVYMILSDIYVEDRLPTRPVLKPSDRFQTAQTVLKPPGPIYITARNYPDRFETGELAHHTKYWQIA